MSRLERLIFKYPSGNIECADIRAMQQSSQNLRSIYPLISQSSAPLSVTMSSALTVIVLGQVYFLNTTSSISNIGELAKNSLNLGGVLRDDYTYTPGVGAHKLHTESATWSDAELTCEEEGGHLAIVNSAAESEALAKLFLRLEGRSRSTELQYAFIGFRKRIHGNGFVTVRGESLEKAGFDVWAATEPNNLHNSERCGSVWMDGKLNDINCDLPFNFICELPLVTLDIPQPIEAPVNQEPCVCGEKTTSIIQDVRPA